MGIGFGLAGAHLGFGLARGYGAAAAAPAWYRAGGSPVPVAAWQAIGAASLAASYVNLAQPGTYDAAPGVAPTFDAATGWTFDSTQYLTTGITPGAGWSLIVRFSDVPNLAQYQPVIGNNLSTPTLALWGADGNQVAYANGGLVEVAPGLASGTLAVAGQQGYRNGVAEGGAIGTAGGTWLALQIGRVANYSNYFVGKIQAAALYDSTISAAQVAALHTAMAAL